MFDFSTDAKEKDARDFLDTARKGLEHLFKQVERAEKDHAKSLGLTGETAKTFGYIDFGSHPDDWLVCNYFVWYANALSNFIGVFTKAFSPAENLKQEFTNVITWRDKVAAHTSWVWPKGDNAATQNMSILLFPEFGLQGDGHFWIGGMRIVTSTGDASRADWHWGLVHTHERLKEIVSKYATAPPRSQKRATNRKAPGRKTR